MSTSTDTSLPAGKSALRFNSRLACSPKDWPDASFYYDYRGLNTFDSTHTGWIYSCAPVYFSGKHYVFVMLNAVSGVSTNTWDQMAAFVSTDGGYTWDWMRDAGGTPRILLSANGAWYSKTHVGDPAAFVGQDGLCHIYYVACDDTPRTMNGGDRVCHATFDGTTITEDANNPVIDTGAIGAWDHMLTARPGACQTPDGVVHVFYDGWPVSNGVGWTDDGLIRVGHATSTDYSHFTKDAANPIAALNNFPNASLIYDDGTIYIEAQDTIFRTNMGAAPFVQTTPQPFQGSSVAYNAPGVYGAGGVLRDPTDGLFYYYASGNVNTSTPLRPFIILIAPKVEILKDGSVVETPTLSRKGDVLFASTGDLTFRIWSPDATTYADSEPVTVASEKTLIVDPTMTVNEYDLGGEIESPYDLGGEIAAAPGSVKFYDSGDAVIDVTNELEIATLEISSTITAKADAGYVAPPITVVSSNSAVRLSTNGTTWASSITLTNVDDIGVDFYVKQTAKLLYGLDAYLVAQIG